jgi:hypothetical protein
MPGLRILSFGPEGCRSKAESLLDLDPYSEYGTDLEPDRYRTEMSL